MSGKFHVKNEKDQSPAHTFLYFSCKLSIIIAIMAAMFFFLTIFYSIIGVTVRGYGLYMDYTLDNHNMNTASWTTQNFSFDIHIDKNMFMGVNLS